MQNKTLLLALGSILILFGSCKKYYFDSGIHDSKYQGSTMEYLKSKSSVFDSTIVIIKLAGLEELLDKENVTFFAPPSGSVFKSIKRLNNSLRSVGKDTVATLEQIKPEVWRNTLSQYIFSGSFLLKDYPQRDTLVYTAYPGQNYASYGGRIMNVGTLFNDAGGVQYAGYRQLFLAYIPDLSNPQTALQNNPVATSDIKTNNGVLHVLTKSKHNLGFNTDTFIDQVMSSGILPLNK